MVFVFATVGIYFIIVFAVGVFSKFLKIVSLVAKLIMSVLENLFGILGTLVVSVTQLFWNGLFGFFI